MTASYKGTNVLVLPHSITSKKNAITHTRLALIIDAQAFQEQPDGGRRKEGNRRFYLTKRSFQTMKVLVFFSIALVYMTGTIYYNHYYLSLPRNNLTNIQELDFILKIHALFKKRREVKELYIAEITVI